MSSIAMNACDSHTDTHPKGPARVKGMKRTLKPLVSAHPGAGATLGRVVTFGYLAGKCLAQ
jgi:hypothetical protein